jgi:hypothetical protein
VYRFIAWSVSINPKGDTYAATGGSGNVSLYSADPESFGQRRAVLPSGRNKFGMFCKYVGLRYTSRTNLACSRVICVNRFSTHIRYKHRTLAHTYLFRVLMEQGSRCHLRLDKCMSLIWLQRSSLQPTLRMPWRYARWPGHRTHR